MRDTFIFYRSFYEAIKELPDAERLKIYDAICDYSLNLKPTDLQGVAAGFFTLIKPQLDANNKRYENGCVAKTKQEESKEQAKGKQDESKGEANKNKNVNKNNNKNTFDAFRKLYPGTKKGNETEFGNFVKKHQDWLVVLPTLEDTIKNQILQRQKKKNNGDFVPEWKHLVTWINQRCWEEILDVEAKSVFVRPPQPHRDSTWNEKRQEWEIDSETIFNTGIR